MWWEGGRREGGREGRGREGRGREEGGREVGVAMPYNDLHPLLKFDSLNGTVLGDFCCR